MFTRHMNGGPTAFGSQVLPPAGFDPPDTLEDLVTEPAVEPKRESVVTTHAGEALVSQLLVFMLRDT